MRLVRVIRHSRLAEAINKDFERLSIQPRSVFFLFSFSLFTHTVSMATVDLLSTAYSQARESPLRAFLISVFLAFLSYTIVNEVVRNNARIKGFSGPAGWPLIGNLWDIRVNAAEQYRIWSKRYGSVYQIQLGNIPVLVVNSASAVKVIFGHNSQALSSRPEFYTFHKVSDMIH